MANVGELVTVLKANTRHFNRGIRSATGLLRGMGGMLKNIASIAGGILLAKVFEAGFNALRKFVGGLIDAAAQMQLINLQLQTLRSREMAGFINEAINASVVWKRLGDDTGTFIFNVEKLKSSLGDMSDDILAVLPKQFQDIFASQNKTVKVMIDGAKQMNGIWVTASDVFQIAEESSKALAKELQKTALLSPFSIETTNQLFKLALAFQFSSDQSMRLTKGMLNVGAGIGATNEQMDRMMFNFAQIRMQGKIMARDFWELGKAGFDLYAVLKEIERQTGYTINSHRDFNAMIASGKLTWEDFVKGFESSAERDFGEAAKRMVFSVVGLKNSLSDLRYVLGPQLFDPMLQEIGKFAGSLFEQFIELAESGELEEIGRKIGEKIGIGLMDIKIAIHQIGLFVQSFQEAGGGVDGLIAGLRTLGQSEGAKEQRDKWFDLADNIEDTKDNVLNILGTFLDLKAALGGEGEFDLNDRLDVKPSTAEGINGLVESLVGLSDWYRENKTNMSAGFATFWVLLESMAGAISDVIKPAWDDLKDSFDEFATDPNLAVIREVLTAIAIVIGSLLVGAIAIAVGVIKGLIAFIGALLEALGKTWNAIRDFGNAIGSAIDAIKAGDMDALKAAFSDAGDAGKEWLGGLVDANIGSLITGITEGVEGSANVLIGTFNRLQEASGGATMDLWDFNTWESLQQDLGAGGGMPYPGGGIPFQPPAPEMFIQSDEERQQQILDSLNQDFARAYAHMELTPHRELGEQLGREIPRGMQLGIEDGTSEVVRAARNMASSIAQAIREELDIRSPSQVMFDIGELTATGFTEGISSGGGFDFDYNTYMAGVQQQIASQTTGGGSAAIAAAATAQANATQALVAKQTADTAQTASIVASNDRGNRQTVTEMQNIGNMIEAALKKLPKQIRDSIVMVSG